MYLGNLIEEKCSKGSWCPLKASWGNLSISHLFFADDLILFAKVNNEICEVIPEVLRIFCMELGQKISNEKSRIYFSANVGEDLKERVCDKLGIFENKDFGKYLGFPLKHNGAPRGQYNFVAERVMKKLAGWKTKFLSFAGRAMLVKSIMSAVPNHVMQGANLPRPLCDKLDKINRDFCGDQLLKRENFILLGGRKL